jgi:hypothetical protein
VSGASERSLIRCWCCCGCWGGKKRAVILYGIFSGGTSPLVDDTSSGVELGTDVFGDRCSSSDVGTPLFSRGFVSVEADGLQRPVSGKLSMCLPHQNGPARPAHHHGAVRKLQPPGCGHQSVTWARGSLLVPCNKFSNIATSVLCHVRDLQELIEYGQPAISPPSPHLRIVTTSTSIQNASPGSLSSASGSLVRSIGRISPRPALSRQPG